MGTQETITYRLAMRNQEFNAFNKFIFGGTMGRHAGAKRSGASRHDHKVDPFFYILKTFQNITNNVQQL